MFNFRFREKKYKVPNIALRKPVFWNVLHVMLKTGTAGPVFKKS